MPPRDTLLSVCTLTKAENTCLFLSIVLFKACRMFKMGTQWFNATKIEVSQDKKLARWGSFLTAVETTSTLSLFCFTALSNIVSIIVIASMWQPFPPKGLNLWSKTFLISLMHIPKEWETVGLMLYGASHTLQELKTLSMIYDQGQWMQVNSLKHLWRAWID